MKKISPELNELLRKAVPHRPSGKTLQAMFAYYPNESHIPFSILAVLLGSVSDDALCQAYQQAENDGHFCTKQAHFSEGQS